MDVSPLQSCLSRSRGDDVSAGSDKGSALPHLVFSGGFPHDSNFGAKIGLRLDRTLTLTEWTYSTPRSWDLLGH